MPLAMETKMDRWCSPAIDDLAETSHRPGSPERRRKFEAAQRTALMRYSKAFKKLAE